MHTGYLSFPRLALQVVREGGRQLAEDNVHRFDKAAARASTNEGKRAIMQALFNNGSTLRTSLMHSTDVCKRWLSWLKAAIAAEDHRLASDIIQALRNLVSAGERSPWMKVCRIALSAISLPLQFIL